MSQSFCRWVSRSGQWQGFAVGLVASTGKHAYFAACTSGTSLYLVSYNGNTDTAAVKEVQLSS